MDYKKIIVGILTLVLITPLSFVESKDEDLLPIEVRIRGSHKISDFDPIVDDWATVEPWEVEYCRKWGGSDQGGVNKGATSKIPIALSQLTVTLQGGKTEYNLTGQSILYTASWYIEPVSGEIDYIVTFIGDGILEIGGGMASNTEAGLGYYSEYINKSFTHVKIDFPGNYLEVPIVS